VGSLTLVRIVVSGTHASGKSTLIADFALQHPEYVVFTDPFDLVDETGAGLFSAQLRIAADRLVEERDQRDVIAERGPLDFLAYLLAWSELTSIPLEEEFLERATLRTRRALATIDLLVVLPLTARDAIHVSADEHVELRAAMNDALLDLLDDPDVVGEHLEVVELTGSPTARVAALDALVATHRTPSDREPTLGARTHTPRARVECGFVH